jgi:prevent-host-death family protein
MSKLDIANEVHSLSDFKRHTSDFVEQLEETGRPVVLTVNGEAKLIVQDAASYQKMVEALEDAKTLRAIAEMKAGNGRPAQEFFEELGKELGIK